MQDTVMHTDETATMRHNNLKHFIDRCWDEKDVDRQARILIELNAKLPASKQLKIPSFITDDYISYALSKIENQAIIDSRGQLTR
jgi:hypothetical protein